VGGTRANRYPTRSRLLETGYMSTEVSEGNTILPPEDLEAMLDLSKFLDQVSAPALVGPDGQTVAVPLEAFQILRQVARAGIDAYGSTTSTNTSSTSVLSDAPNSTS
jgi:hypothetical protein